jgi:hypothetical protein
LQSGCFIESYLVMPVSIILCLIESYLVMPVSIIFQCLFTPTKVLLLILISLIRTFKWVISLLAAFLKLCLVSSGLAVLTTIVSPLAWGIDDVLDRFLHIVSTVASLPMAATTYLSVLGSLLKPKCFKMLILLPCFAIAVDDFTSIKFDPTKRVPMLAEGNYAEWSWRISTVFISMGVGVGILSMYQPAQDVGANPNLVQTTEGPYVRTEEIRQMLDELNILQARRRLANGDDHTRLTEEHTQKKSAVALLIQKAIEDYKQSVSVTPFSDLTNKAKIQCFRILCSTISSDLDFLVMNFLPSQFDEAWFAVRDYFQTNTRGARMDSKLKFFSMEMPSEMKFAEFKNKIEFTARQINSMSVGTTIITDDDKLTILFRGVRRNHGPTFKTTLEILEQDPNPLSFEEAYKKMLVVARRGESAHSTGVHEQGMSVKGRPTDNINVMVNVALVTIVNLHTHVIVITHHNNNTTLIGTHHNHNTAGRQGVGRVIFAVLNFILNEFVARNRRLTRNKSTLLNSSRTITWLCNRSTKTCWTNTTAQSLQRQFTNRNHVINGRTNGATR